MDYIHLILYAIAFLWLFMVVEEDIPDRLVIPIFVIAIVVPIVIFINLLARDFNF